MAEARPNKPTVYVETTIVSYLTTWPTRDVIRQAQQELTKQWWQDRRPDFELFISQFVLDEAAAGDATAAADRLAVLNQITLLHIGEEVEPLAQRLLRDGALPLKAGLDALHVAVSTVNGVEFLLTWNCKHLANAVMWPRIEKVPFGRVCPADHLHAVRTHWDEPMTTDPIIEEIHRVRDAIAAKFDNDLAAIAADARERELASGRMVVSLPPRRAEPAAPAPKKVAG